MQLCQRCGNQPATVTSAGLPMCQLCAMAMSERFGTSIEALHAPISAPVPVTFVGQDASPYQYANVFDSIPGPYAIGQKLGHQASAAMPGVTSAITNAASSSGLGKAVGETASAVKTVAIVAGLLGAAVVVYFIYNAHKTADRGLHLLETHPELAKLAIL